MWLERNRKRRWVHLMAFVVPTGHFLFSLKVVVNSPQPRPKLVSLSALPMKKTWALTLFLGLSDGNRTVFAQWPWGEELSYLNSSRKCQNICDRWRLRRIRLSSLFLFVAGENTFPGYTWEKPLKHRVVEIWSCWEIIKLSSSPIPLILYMRTEC